MERKVVAVIVNYKTPGLVMDCLETLEKERDRVPDFPLTVIIVDNRSPDDSCRILEKGIKERHLSNWVTLVAHNENGGFSAGNNVGFRKILNDENSGAYVWLLNSDTLVHPGAYVALIQFFEDHPGAGIAGSRLEDPDGKVQVSSFNDFSVKSEMLAGFRFSLLTRLFKKWDLIPEEIALVPTMTDWVAGASMMVRKKILKDVGLFDEKYFLYFEEVDFCLNVRRAGWECWYVPDSRVTHLVGASTGISELRKKAPRRPAYWFESRRYFFLKNYGTLTLLMADFWFILGYITFRIRKAFSNDVKREPPRFLSDFLYHSVFKKGFKH